MGHPGGVSRQKAKTVNFGVINSPSGDDGSEARVAVSDHDDEDDQGWAWPYTDNAMSIAQTVEGGGKSSIVRHHSAEKAVFRFEQYEARGLKEATEDNLLLLSRKAEDARQRLPGVHPMNAANVCCRLGHRHVPSI